MDSSIPLLRVPTSAAFNEKTISKHIIIKKIFLDWQTIANLKTLTVCVSELWIDWTGVE